MLALSSGEVNWLQAASHWVSFSRASLRRGHVAPQRIARVTSATVALGDGGQEQDAAAWRLLLSRSSQESQAKAATQRSTINNVTTHWRSLFTAMLGQRSRATPQRSMFGMGTSRRHWPWCVTQRSIWELAHESTTWHIMV